MFISAIATQMTASELNSLEYGKLAYIEKISLELQNGYNRIQESGISVHAHLPKWPHNIQFKRLPYTIADS
jgi:hypothetical protein